MQSRISERREKLRLLQEAHVADVNNPTDDNTFVEDNSAITMESAAVVLGQPTPNANNSKAQAQDKARLDREV